MGRIKFLFGGGGDSFVTSVVASYAASTNDGLFVVQRSQGNPATSDKILMSINVAQNRVEYSRNGGTGNAVSQTKFIHNALLNTAIRGRDQFAQGTIATARIAGDDDGPAVLIQGDPALDQGVQNAGNGYVAAPNPGALPQNLLIRRATITETILQNTGVAVNLNDVIRIEVRVVTGGTQWEVKAFVNGVQAGTTITENASGNAPIGSYGGYPGHHVGNIPIPASTFTGWSAQSWGKL